MASVSDIARAVLRDHDGDYSAAIGYCARIAAVNGPLASDYRAAAKLIKKKALGPHHSNRHLLASGGVLVGVLAFLALCAGAVVFGVVFSRWICGIGGVQ